MEIYRRLLRSRQLGGLVPVFRLGVSLRSKASKLENMTKIFLQRRTLTLEYDQKIDIDEHYPPASEASRGFTEIRHLKLELFSTLSNFQLFSSQLECVDGPIGH